MFRASISISPEAKEVNRVLPVVGTNSIASESFKTAAATARHTAMSKPCHTPFASGCAKPGTPVLTPQFSLPRALTSSRVPADTMPAARPATANAPKNMVFFIFTPSYCQSRSGRSNPILLIGMNAKELPPQ